MDYDIEHMVTSAHTVRTTYPLTTRNYCKQSLGQHNPSRRKLLIFATMQGEATYFLYYGMPSRSIPSIRDGLSPVQKLYGHPIQGTILIQEQAFSPEGSTVEKRQSDTLSNHRRQLQQDTISQPAASLPDITMGKNVAVQNTRTRSWDTYGLVTFIGPYRQYHVHTARGKVLVQNHRFPCRHVPGSIPPGQM